MIRHTLLLAIVAATFGCSSSDSTNAAPKDSGSTDVAEPTAPAASCVKAGDKGNDKGVGTPCTPFGKECDAFPGAPVCLADVGQDQWMCTRIGCTGDEQCGSGATCYKDPGGSACVPNRCLDAPPDAGSDAATSDGASDAATSDGATDAASAG